MRRTALLLLLLALPGLLLGRVGQVRVCLPELLGITLYAALFAAPDCCSEKAAVPSCCREESGSGSRAQAQERQCSGCCLELSGENREVAFERTQRAETPENGQVLLLAAVEPERGTSGVPAGGRHDLARAGCRPSLPPPGRGTTPLPLRI